MKYFVSGSTARTAADLAGVHRNTAIRFFHKLRCSIAVKQKERAAQFAGEIELDESYLVVIAKVCALEDRLERLLFSAFLNGVAKSISKLS